MRFNPSKCTVLRISRAKLPLLANYHLCGETLEGVREVKYLGIIISNTLSWSSQVDVVSKKASNVLNFVRRNLKHCPKKSKEMAYFSLVRSTLDYSAAVWDPHLKKDQDKLEMINRRSARFVTNDYSNTSSVTNMLYSLKWPSLESRREHQRLALMYRIVHGLVAVPSTKLIPADGRTRANHQYKFKSISSSSTVYKHSFFPRTIPAWNSLPNTVVDCATLDSFKANLIK